MVAGTSVRIYDLARELKQDTKRVIEELRREGADVSVPSNSVSKELAEKVRNKYFPKTEAVPKYAVKIIKKGTKDVITPYSKKMTDAPQKQKICQYCSKLISRKHFVKRFKEHINECPKNPVFSIKNMLKYFDLMTERTNSVNNKRLAPTELASYLIDSQIISNFNIGYSPIHYFTDNYPIATVDNGKKKLKVVIVNELFNLYSPSRIKLDSILDFISRDFVKFKAGDSEKLLKWLKKVASYYINKRKNLGKTFQEIQNKNNLIETEDMNWEIFPVGEWFENKNATSKLFDYFRNLQNKVKWRNKFFDKSRLDGIYEKLNPQPPIYGKKKFEGYIVYFFDWTDKVILDCPIYGNATYVIKSGKYSWQEIAKNSKFEARTEYSEQVAIINHNETWLERLEQNLRYGL